MREVTISPGVESVRFVQIGDEGGGDVDDGQSRALRMLPQAAADLKPMEVGQVHIEQH